MLFPDLATIPNEREILIEFVSAYEKHIMCIIGFERFENYQMPRMSSDLKDILGVDGKDEIRAEFQEVRDALRDTPYRILRKHGLVGKQLHFKLSYLNSRESLLYNANGQFVFDPKIAMSVGSIGSTIFESVMDASGVGAGVKEIGSIAGNAVGDAVDDDLNGR